MCAHIDMGGRVCRRVYIYINHTINNRSYVENERWIQDISMCRGAMRHLEYLSIREKKEFMESHSPKLRIDKVIMGPGRRGCRGV